MEFIDERFARGHPAALLPKLIGASVVDHTAIVRTSLACDARCSNADQRLRVRSSIDPASMMCVGPRTVSPAIDHVAQHVTNPGRYGARLTNERDSLTARFATQCAEFSHDRIPAATRQRSKLILLDTLGAMLSALRSSFHGTTALASFVEQEGADGPCRVIGTSLRTSPTNAALMNGYLGYALDVESHHGPAVAHAAAAVLPAALAVGEQTHASGRQLLDALVLGIEVDCRVSLAIGPNDLYARGFHPTSVAGSFGAAAAAGHLLPPGFSGRYLCFRIGGISGGRAPGVGRRSHGRIQTIQSGTCRAQRGDGIPVSKAGIWRATDNLRCHVQIPRLPCLGAGWIRTSRCAGPGIWRHVCDRRAHHQETRLLRLLASRS